jgi:hypothetical protein
MNTRERFFAGMNFQKPDRNLLWEMGYWPETLDFCYYRRKLRDLIEEQARREM